MSTELHDNAQHDDGAAERSSTPLPVARLADGPCVLMVSGGADSTALLVLAQGGALGVSHDNLHVLHVNHQLRGEDADADEAHVRALCDQFDLPLHVVRADVAALAQAEGVNNIEQMGRMLRYREAAKLARTLAKPQQPCLIATAHTADDRAETFLINVMQGAGMQGLRSIPARRNTVVRPLLGITHEQACAYLCAHNISWQEDATNDDTSYLRSYVRHEILPRMKARNPQVVQHINTTCSLIQAEDSFMQKCAWDALNQGILRRDEKGLVVLQAARFAQLDVALQRRVMRIALLKVDGSIRLDALGVERACSCVRAGKGACHVTGSVEVRTEQGLVFVRSLTQSTSTNVSPTWCALPGVTEILGARGRLVAQFVEAPAQGSVVEWARREAAEWMGQVAIVDAQDIHQLWVSRPYAGQVMQPLGMKGHSRKLSDLLQEAGVPASLRGQVPVVSIGPEQPVVWLPGIHVDERFKVGPQTHKLLRLWFQTF